MNELKVNCKEVWNHICESLSEELNSPKCRAIREHLSKCTTCQNYFDSVEKTIDFYRKYNVHMPGESHEKLMELLNLNEK